uniref:Uncharacterized protein n=2 Tax=Noccaea caerulescens TaxID=107243 RepID=A0A1J3G0P6_NOCCA
MNCFDESRQEKTKEAKQRYIIVDFSSGVGHSKTSPPWILKNAKSQVHLLRPSPAVFIIEILFGVLSPPHASFSALSSTVA